MTKEEFITYLNSFNKDSGEFTEDELYEIGCKFKNELPLSEKDWSWLVEKLGPVNAKGEPKSGETFRIWIKSRQYQKGDIKKNEQLLSGQTIHDLTFEEFEEKTEEIKRDLYKQQVKTRDSWNAYRKTMRAEARDEDFQEMLIQAVEKGLGKLPAVEFAGDEVNPTVEMAPLFSDLHLGVEVDKYFNKFNVEIARKSVWKYFTKIIQKAEIEKPQRINFINLGDLIAGHIHVNGRLEQEIDVIEQITTVCEILAENLVRLQAAAPEVIYRSVTDNHSRATPSYKENLEKENFGRIIDFYLEARLKDTNIQFAHDNLDEEVGMFELLNGKKLLFVHGHHDNYNTICQNFVGATREFIDYIVLGHYHNSKVKTFQGAKVIVNGSIVGTDSYAYSKRLFGDPEQTILVFKGDDLGVEYINLRNQ